MKPDVDRRWQWAGCQFLSRQLAKLMKHLQGARVADDIEDVHQARVACRRLRSGLTVFADCFDDGKLRTWDKRLKKLLKSFGAARDLDVQIDFLRQELAGLDAGSRRHRPGVKRMLLRWQDRRDAMQPAVVKAVDRLAKDHVLMNIHLEVERILFELRGAAIPSSEAAIAARALAALEPRRTDLAQRCACLQDAEAIEAHHAMRIAAKKLRYTMEIFDAALDGRLKGPIKKIKTLQTLLGDLHDCDVWDADIAAFMETEKQRTIAYYGHARPFSRLVPGLEALRQQRRRRRSERFDEAAAFVETLDQASFWQTCLDGLKTTESKPQPEVMADERDREPADADD